MAKRMGKGLVALSSAAIVSVYGIGYAVTQPAAVSMAAGVAPSASAASSPMSSPAAGAAAAPPTGAVAPPVAGASTVQPATSPASTATTSALKDGTYTGTGWSRHGSVSASVTVQGGRIVSAPITGVTTRYSQSVIAGLPAKVVAAQSGRVDLVSGATDSTDAYQSAVSQALAQAGGPATSVNSAPSGGSVQVTGPNGTIYSNGGGRRNRGGGGNFGY